MGMRRKKQTKKQGMNSESGPQPSARDNINAKQRTLYADIVSLRCEEHLTYSQIASKLNTSNYTVFTYLSKWKKGVPVEKMRARGRPLKANDTLKRQIRSIVAANQHISSHGITKKLCQSNGNDPEKTISEWMIRRCLNDISYSISIPLNIPKVTDVQKTKRVQWCRKHHVRIGRKFF
jgi:transposase